MTELFRFLATNNLTMKAEYVNGVLVVFLTKIDTDFCCTFAPGNIENYNELFVNFLNPSLIALNKVKS